LPCNDLFDWWTLRCGVWIVFLLALMGNGTVVFVQIFARTKMDVPRFLVCNLAVADFFMGVYLGKTTLYYIEILHYIFLQDFLPSTYTKVFLLSPIRSNFISKRQMQTQYTLMHRCRKTERKSNKVEIPSYWSWIFINFSSEMNLFPEQTKIVVRRVKSSLIFPQVFLP
jgi:hypothetical protein